MDDRSAGTKKSAGNRHRVGCSRYVRQEYGSSSMADQFTDAWLKGQNLSRGYGNPALRENANNAPGPKPPDGLKGRSARGMTPLCGDYSGETPQELGVWGHLVRGHHPFDELPQPGLNQKWIDGGAVVANHDKRPFQAPEMIFALDP